MQDMKFAFVTAAVAALLSTSAMAADITGARVEGIIGYDSPQVSIDDEDVDDLGLDFDMDGIVYGIGLGYDFAVQPNLSVGVDAEYTDSTSDFDYSEGTESLDVSIGRDLYVGGRVTTAISDSFNLYGKVGYTNARVKARYSNGTDSFSETDNGDGIRAGVGGQFALAGNSYLGLEYRYSNYEADVERHQVAASLGFRF